MCSGNGGHGGADLEPKLDLILWLGSLRLTCQGLLGFFSSAASSFHGDALGCPLSLHVDPPSVPGWQVRKRSGWQPEAKVAKLWELPAGLPIAHLSTSSILPSFVHHCVARGGEDSGMRGLVEAWEPVWRRPILAFLSLKVARPCPGCRALSPIPVVLSIAPPTSIH